MAKKDDRSLEELRAERESIHKQIESLRVKSRDLSAKIREKEGPIPDRANRRTQFRIS